jgi:hypothetical protein
MPSCIDCTNLCTLAYALKRIHHFWNPSCVPSNAGNFTDLISLSVILTSALSLRYGQSTVVNLFNRPFPSLLRSILRGSTKGLSVCINIFWNFFWQVKSSKQKWRTNRHFQSLVCSSKTSSQTSKQIFEANPTAISPHHQKIHHTKRTFLFSSPCISFLTTMIC